MIDEKVLCYPRSVVEAAGIKPGFTAFNYPPGDLDEIAKGTYLSRSEVEQDESWVQVVAYTVIWTLDRSRLWPRMLCYRRTPKGGEGRLQGLCSVGIGGHVTDDDSMTQWAFIVARASAERELEEELWNPWDRFKDGDLEFIGIVYDDITPVSRVHLGLVYKVETSWGEEFHPNRNDGTIEILGWVDRDGRLPDGTIPGEYEAWSRHVLEAR